MSTSEARASGSERSPLLEARRVRRSFGGLCAVDVEYFTVEEHSIVALIGPNGAGKTTFFNVLTGFERADSGAWTFQGRDLSGKPAYRIARAGMVRTFQIPRALSRMTVLDNMKLASVHQRGERIFPRARGSVVAAPGGRRPRPSARAARLGGAQRQAQ